MNTNLHIIILTYNCINKIKKCLSLLYKNTNTNFKLFIIENNSKDGTKEYIKIISKEKNNLFLNIQKENLGIIKGRNLGYKFSKKIDKSDLIFFLDADQMMQAGWIESYLEIMQNGNFDLVGCEAWQLNNNYYPIKKITNPKDHFSYVGGGGLLIKSEIFEKLGLFDEDYDFVYFEDPSLCLLANKNGYKIGWNHKPVIIHEHSGPLLNKNRKKYFMKNWKLFQNKWNGHKIPVFKMK